MHSVVARRLVMMSDSEVALKSRSTSLDNAVASYYAGLRRTSLVLHGKRRGIYTIGRRAQTKRHCVLRRKESIAMME